MHKATILVADNDSTALRNLEKFFKKHGYSTLSAGDISSAKKALRDKNFDLAVLDIRLNKDADEGDISGLVLARTLSPEVPKIIYTKFPTYKYVREAFAGGSREIPPAVDFVAKQEGLPALLASVKSGLKVAANNRFLKELGNGNHAAWNQLWDEEAWRLIALGRRYGLNDNDAMRICVDAFGDLAKNTSSATIQLTPKGFPLRTVLTEKVLERIKKLRPRAAPKPRPLGYLHSEKSRASLIDQELLAEIAAPAIAKKISRRKLVNQLSRAIKELPPRRQQIVTLRLFQGVRPPEIEKKLRLTERTVRKHLDSGLGHLKTKIAELGEK